MAKINIRLLPLLVVLIATLSVSAQEEKHIHSREQLWLAVFNQTRLTERWGM